MSRQSDYGKCKDCDNYNTFYGWCQSCDPEKTIQGWSSGDDNIDNCIKMFQRDAIMYDEVVEWIPFDKLNNVQKIGEGGYGSVFSAIWSDGIPVTEYIDGNWVWSRKKSSIVALKTLPSSQDRSKCLEEFEKHMRCRLMGIDLEIYGFTKCTENSEYLKAGDYLMVLQYANEGSLDKFLKKNFKNLTWENKLSQLIDVTSDLVKIHNEGYSHSDFHSGNILQNRIGPIVVSYISDFGLAKKDNKKDNQNNEISGILPDVAPEVIMGKNYTPAADIYGLGIIMAEMSTGQRPFDGHNFDHRLALKICRGLRPKFAPETPNCYIKLAEKCMDQDPLKRPTANEILLKLHHLHRIISNYNSTDKLGIKKKFLDADEEIKKSPDIERKHPDATYTSKDITKMSQEIMHKEDIQHVKDFPSEDEIEKENK